MNEIIISRFKLGQETEISLFIKKVYDEFVAIDYPDEGNRFFYEWIEPAKIAERQQKGRTILVAKSGDEIAGMIEIRGNDHISLLFVGKEYQKQGIAKKLFNRALKSCLHKDPGLEKFQVHASPYSLEVYKALGFRLAGELTQTNGILYYPMEMVLLPGLLFQR
jgi:GNAT superfamily N-acetyltransferase